MKKNATLQSKKSWLIKAALAIFITLSTVFPSFSQILINENFNTITTAAPIPAGWAQQNLSTPVGTRPTWFQGVPAAFPAFNGAPNSYIAANYQNVAGTATLSNWLFTPTITVKNGDQITFYTRTNDPSANGGVTYPDRLQVRLSTSGTSVNAGATNTSVGDFTNLLLEVNPNLTVTGYPFVWTKYTATVTGVPSPLQGRVAFRYFVTNNANGDFADYIGLDNIVYDGTPCTNTPATAPILSASALSVCAGTPVTLTANGTLNNSATYQFFTGSCNGTVIGTGNTVTVSPTVTTTYFAGGTGGCGTTPNGQCGQITITVVPCACISPSAATICEGSIQTLSVTGAPIVQTFTSAVTITIPNSGNATPYPSTIAVTGVAAGARVKSITLGGVTHTWPQDIDAAVVSPTNTPLIIMSDVGGTSTITNRSYTFDDAAAATMGTGTTPAGTYRPSNPDAPDNFPTPGPGSLSQINPLLNSFTGNMNGNWNLFVVDDAGGDQGSMSGWSITFETFPTAVWTGAGPIFTDPGATIPYVAGSPANTVYVNPTSTTTYTATISSGPCAGANNVVVTVLSRPIVTVTPTSGCGPLTITASGAANYTWTPAAGLSTTTGPTVTASPSVTTTYTVTGINANGCSATPVSVLVNASPTASVISAVAAGPALQINEGFEVVPPTGWSTQNLSQPVGTLSWFQGNPAAFASFDGAPNAYAAANFNSTTPNGTISSWLFTPTTALRNGDVVSFYTRAATSFAGRAERLELRMSTNGNSTNAGTTSTSTGDFTTLLLSVNPNLLPGSANYPEVWTQYQATISGITGTVNGKFALRYFVTNGGNVPGFNSNFIGVDRFQYGTPFNGINCANVTTNIKIDITGGVGPYIVVYSNGTTNTTVNGYVSGSNIQVSPSATTTYTIVSVTGANGCAGAGNSGSAIITITPPPSITTQPVDKTVCVGNNTTVSVVAGPAAGTTYQWQLSTDAGVTYTNLSNTAPYSGVTTSTLTITGATLAMNGYRYRVVINGACPPAIATSTASILSVNTPAVITTQPAATVTSCSTGGGTLTVAATGNQLTYQWQVSTDAGVTYTNITNGTNYSGVTTNTLMFVSIPVSFSNYRYRVLVSSGGCSGTISAASTLTVTPIPVVTISAAPIRNLFPGLTTTLTAAVSSATPPITYQWFRNGAAVPGATNNTLVVGIDQLGTYTVRATAQGCTSADSTTTPRTIVIADSVGVTRLFIYPSPNTGKFQVRYFNDVNTFSPSGINVYDEKGARVFTRTYVAGPRGYTQFNVDLGAHGRGIYRVELVNTNGDRIKTGSVMVF